MSSAGKITVPALMRKKAEGEPIVMVTCYDATFARLVDQSSVDIVLVGDSLGMVMQGRSHTLEVSVEDIAYHTRCVQRVLRRAQLVADMPFMSYQVSPEKALENAGRLVREGGAEAVKLEGGERVLEAVRRISEAGIPVMGHLGLTPQSFHAFGGFKVQAKQDEEAERLIKDAIALQEAGAYSIVIEGIPAGLSKRVSEAVQVPTIGIGAGVDCDGQVLVIQDLLGLDDGFKPKFVKKYASLAGVVRDALNSYADEVRSRSFPDADHSFGLKGKGNATPSTPKDEDEDPPKGGYGPM
jgi:3-methyl-2-oxobutanoate hydroxymethyltransferase